MPEFPIGIKFDGEKARMDLLEPIFLEGIANVLTAGAAKYGDHNWKKGIVASRLYAATQRHLWAFWAGEDIDPDSDMNHLLHAACELMFLYWTVMFRADLDDRWHKLPDDPEPPAPGEPVQVANLMVPLKPEDDYYP